MTTAPVPRFGGKRSGFYVDVGAGHPTEDSVTRHFYDLGWRGINVEPINPLEPVMQTCMVSGPWVSCAA